MSEVNGNAVKTYSCLNEIFEVKVDDKVFEVFTYFSLLSMKSRVAIYHNYEEVEKLEWFNDDIRNRIMNELGDAAIHHLHDTGANIVDIGDFDIINMDHAEIIESSVM
jgi:hypothetical protein